MSTTMQEKFTAAMQRLADERGLDLVIESEHANTGHYSFQRREGFEPVLRFPYDFQHGYSSFTLGTGDPGALGARHEETRRGFSRLEGEEVDAVVVRVGEVLDGNGYYPGRREDFVLREEALVQVQHLAYETLVAIDVPFESEEQRAETLDLAIKRLSRINGIAEGMHPDEQWTPIREDGDGNVVAGGDRELALFDKQEST